MTTFSAKQEKRQAFGNSLPILVAVLLIGAFVILAPLNASFYSSLNGVLGTWSNTDGIYVDAEVLSFTADQTYWDANCTHGWTSDAACDGILSRVQSCAVSVASPYCASYENYLQQFFNK
ncbi:MAG TPA: hypothetical protein VJM08_15885 [Anaerolineales bacterium]|nr:hypothetical protein [Anaerolineales bacterium]